MALKTLKGFNRNRKVTFNKIHADPLIRMKQYSNTHVNIYAASSKNGKPATGLTEDITGLRDEKSKVLPNILGTRKVLEYELGLQDGELLPQSKFWETYLVKYSGAPETLNLADPDDLLKYLFLLAQPHVSPTLAEVKNDSIYEFVISSDEQEASVKVAKKNHLKKAYVVSDSLDMETRIQLLTAYGHSVDSTQPNTIITALDEEIEADPKGFLELVEDDFLVYRALVRKCLTAGILTKADGGIKHSDFLVGIDYKTTAEAIAGNEKLEAVLKAKLSGSMDLIRETLAKE